MRRLWKQSNYFLAFLNLLYLSALNSCAGGCPTREVTQELAQLESYQVIISDPGPVEFTVEVTPDQPSPGFQVIDGYIYPSKPPPSDGISFKFFFRDDALPGGESIFDQMEGEVFSYQNVPYDGQDIIYIEFAPNTPDYVPTSYSGTVSITDPNHVLFDLTFTNGSQSRRVESVFFFQTATFDSPIGECEP
ncbi:hypothetical protein FBR05_05025 [Deltaproteobacteria bacterium PRO3]|nr:hypothetical protein [Deltaproteobacteria bacterium PRO3]